MLLLTPLLTPRHFKIVNNSIYEDKLYPFRATIDARGNTTQWREMNKIKFSAQRELEQTYNHTAAESRQ